jgi:formamidopyrimidine-DNA glycosylase
MRNLLGGDPADHLVEQRFTHIGRRDMFLLFSLENGVPMAIHPMLAGRIWYGQPLARHRVRDVLVLRLVNGRELRYHDAIDMGKVYRTDDLNQVPRSALQGLEATDAGLTLDVFRQRLLRHRDADRPWTLGQQGR